MDGFAKGGMRFPSPMNQNRIEPAPALAEWKAENRRQKQPLAITQVENIRLASTGSCYSVYD